MNAFDLIDLKLYKTKQFLKDTATSNAVVYKELLFIGDESGFINVLDSVSLQTIKFKVAEKKVKSCQIFKEHLLVTC